MNFDDCKIGGEIVKNRKKIYTLVAILVAIVALGIGYAAVSTLLEIDGTATVLESDGVKLEFTGTPTNSGTEDGNAAAINGSDSSKATCTVVLKNINDTATCSYTVANNSTDTTLTAANLAINVYSDSGYSTTWVNGNTNPSSQYFDITSSIGATTLANAATTTATVTVTLKKENTTGSSITENFYVKVSGETQQS